MNERAKERQVTSSPVEREKQRVTYLVLGASRPQQKLTSRRKKSKIPPVIVLVPGVEERVQLRERWSHKAHGTPETLEHVATEAMREGALARLHTIGSIDAHQLAAAQQILEAHRALVADVAVRTAKFERSTGSGPDAASAERIGAVILDRAYSAWRQAVEPHGAMLLSIIVDDIGLTIAARRWRMSNRRARAVLVAALDRWRKH